MARRSGRDRDKVESPHDRAELKAAMAELTAQYDIVLADVSQLEAGTASRLDTVHLERLLVTAEDIAKDELALRTKRLVLRSLERRFNEIAGRVIEVEREWAKAEVAKVQPDLDVLAAEVAEQLDAVLGKLGQMRDIESDLYTRLGLSAYIWFPESFAEQIKHRLDTYVHERASRF